MTLDDIFRGAAGATSTEIRQPYRTKSEPVLSERDGGVYGYGYGYSTKPKGKYKSEKKHAAMSALTLLAFLFFLNILQNCLREQTQPIASEVTMMMMVPTPQKHVNEPTRYVPVEHDRGGREDASESRRTRSLLSVAEDRGRGSDEVVDFVRRFGDANRNWTRALSRLSTEEIENHRAKTDNLRSHPKRRRKTSAEAAAAEPSSTPTLAPGPHLRGFDESESHRLPGAAHRGKTSDNSALDRGTFASHPLYANHRAEESASTPTTERRPATIGKNPFGGYGGRQRQRKRPVGYFARGRTREPSPRRRPLREEYYPVAAIGKRPHEDDAEFDLAKFAWSLASGFATHLSRLVPHSAKVDGDERAHCYDLIACEAHRMGRLAGPTAEAVASALSALLTWYAPEGDRRNVMEAASSGKENTCQRQIVNCNRRSGGISALTVAAQMLETKWG